MGALVALLPFVGAFVPSPKPSLETIGAKVSALAFGKDGDGCPQHGTGDTAEDARQTLAAMLLAAGIDEGGGFMKAVARCAGEGAPDRCADAVVEKFRADSAALGDVVRQAEFLKGAVEQVVPCAVPGSTRNQFASTNALLEAAGVNEEGAVMTAISTCIDREPGLGADSHDLYVCLKGELQSSQAADELAALHAEIKHGRGRRGASVEEWWLVGQADELSPYCPANAPFLGFIGAAYESWKSKRWLHPPKNVQTELGLAPYFWALFALWPVLVPLDFLALLLRVRKPTGIFYDENNSLFTDDAHLGAGLAVGLSNLATGLALGMAGEIGVQDSARQPKLYIGMVLIWSFGSALGLYGLIVGLIMGMKSGNNLCGCMFNDEGILECKGEL